MASTGRSCSGKHFGAFSSRSGCWWTAFGASGLLFAALLAAFVPYWESNDDVGMAMLAHGFGLAAQDSPHLIFSSLVWGWLVRSIPLWLHTSGYAWASLAVLFCSGAVIFRTVDRLSHGALVAGLVLVLVMVRPILFPQFTINAGLLCVCAIAAWRCHARSVAGSERGAWIDLALGCLFAFLSYLVRSQEFLLVAALGIPLVPWRVLVTRRAGQAALMVLVSAIAVAAFVDHQGSNSKDWAAFNAHNVARAPFTDFGAGERLKLHPEIFEKYGFSTNDIDLVSYWFFVDTALVEPRRLHRMLDELGPAANPTGGVQRVLSGIRTFLEPSLLPLSATALVLLLLHCSARLCAVWIFCVAAAMAMGWLGRPGVTRVYVPIVTLLVIAPYLSGPFTGSWRRKAGIAALVFGTAANAIQVFGESRAAHLAAEKLHQSMAGLPPMVIAVWGDGFPYQLAFPVIGPSFAADFRFYGLGVFTRAPVSTAFALENQGEGLVRRLQSVDGLDIVADLRWLEIYCKEHLAAKLVRLESRTFSGFTLQRIRCERTENGLHSAGTMERL